ncbi:MAG: hypothetical protein JEZ06_00110 [Anaerolineaceae bacterium]|nr:hypothetical protein [Anaerolineaceae bacterium]
MGTAWGLFVPVLGVVIEPTPENWTLICSIWTAGLYTAGLYITRKWWLSILSKHPLRNAAILGSFNAVVIETEFLVFEKVFGAVGVAAHPNLIIDLLMTMPWYILMCITFIRVQDRRRFSAPIVLLLGGLYEMGADGIIAPFFGLFSGDSQILTLEYWLMMGTMMFWAFIPVYSSMLLAPSWLIAQKPSSILNSSSAWRDAVKPLFFLIPFSIYLLLFMLLILILGLDQ